MVTVDALRDQDVAGLDVPVDQAVLVGGVEGGGDLRGDPYGVRQRQWSAQVEEAAQVAAGDVPHGDVEHSVRLAGLEDRHDVRVVDRRGHLGLVGEALAEGVVAGEFGGEQLEGDRALQAQVAGPVDDGHATAPDLALDEIARHLPADQLRGPAGEQTGLACHQRSPSGATSRVGACPVSPSPVTARSVA